MSEKATHIFFEKSQALDVPYQLGDDSRPLQVAFASLVDEAAQAIYRAGSDLDEIIVERIFLVGTQEMTHEIPASFLADGRLLKKSVLDYFARSNSSYQTNGLEIVALKIIARHDQLSQAQDPSENK
jgi:hypothetical protein